MGIFIRAVVKCDGWYSNQCHAGPGDVPASSEALLSVREEDVSFRQRDEDDISFDRALFSVAERPDGWDVQQDGRVRCPTCIKDEYDHRARERERIKIEAEKKKKAAIERGLARMRTRT